MSDNPYSPPQSPPEPAETPEPVEADVAYRSPVWTRVLFLAVPFLAGAMTAFAIGDFADGQHLIAAVFAGLAVAMLVMAWRWTR